MLCLVGSSFTVILERKVGKSVQKLRKSLRAVAYVILWINGFTYYMVHLA